ncbi:ERF family protein [Liquorilactobacillus mali]|uniref:Sak2 n=1 Tax=Liquorilactobacillus mali TaxID=1618 RepID=A0A0R2FXP1_9LACO|nr:ERF family protein [Liquorilactobacillus mali]KRN31125.1 Sak2 [Liquorilactobacillus mali]
MTEEKQSALVTIQSTLKAPKGQFNKFGKYNYRSTEDILTALKPILRALNSTLTITDEPTLIGEWHYIKATATLTTPDGEFKTTGYARESVSKKGFDESQITGTASSYARKYALNGLFLIDDTKDADTDEHYNQTNRETKKTTNQSAKKSYQKNDPLIQKKALINGYSKAIALATQSDVGTVQREAVKQAETKPEWKMADKNEKANITCGILEEMKNRLGKDKVFKEV